jgi:hypothetical protein
LLPAKTRLLGSVSIPVTELLEAQETYNTKLAMGLMPLPTKLRSWYTLTNASGLKLKGDVYLLIKLDSSELQRRKSSKSAHHRAAPHAEAAPVMEDAVVGERGAEVRAGVSEHHKRLQRLSEARALKERITKTADELQQAKATSDTIRQVGRSHEAKLSPVVAGTGLEMTFGPGVCGRVG